MCIFNIPAITRTKAGVRTPAFEVPDDQCSSPVAPVKNTTAPENSCARSNLNELLSSKVLIGGAVAGAQPLLFTQRKLASY
jgi:hypothetical protein